MTPYELLEKHQFRTLFGFSDTDEMREERREYMGLSTNNALAEVESADTLSSDEDASTNNQFG